MKWCFLIGSADIGGGTHVVFQHALHAFNAGIDVTIVTETQVHHNQLNWFESVKKLQWSTYEKEKTTHYDVVISTWWKTIYKMPKIFADSYIYFVQSIESRFYPQEDAAMRMLADATYTLPFHYITEAQWIQEYLNTNYGHEAGLVRNGIDKSVFVPHGTAKAEKSKDIFRVLVEGPVDVPFKNVPKAIDLCRQAGADEVWLLTSTPVGKFQGVDRVFSQIPINEVAEVYRSCEVIVKLSYVEGMFGPPLEMFHCGGTSVTYDVTGSDEYIINGYNGIIVKRDDDAAVVSSIKTLKEDAQFLVKLQANALITADTWVNWQQSCGLFMQAVLQAAEKPMAMKKENMACVLKHYEKWFDAFENSSAVKQKTHTIKNVKKWVRERHPRIFNRLKNIKMSIKNSH